MLRQEEGIVTMEQKGGGRLARFDVRKPRNDKKDQKDINTVTVQCFSLVWRCWNLESVERFEARPDQAFENQKWEEQQDRDRKAREMQEARP